MPLSQPRITRRAFAATACSFVCGPAWARSSPAPAAPAADPALAIEALAARLLNEDRDGARRALEAALAAGTPEEQAVASMAIAGASAIAPRPSLGPDFHGVLVAPSLAASVRVLDRPAERRLAALWGVDLMKELAERHHAEGGPALPPAPAFRASARADAELALALEAWDETRADAAVCALHAQGRQAAAFELLFKYAARDLRDIGHKPIYASGVRRLLATLPWSAAQPLMRSVTLALLRHEGSTPPQDDRFDASWPEHRALLRRMPGALVSARGADAGVTRRLLAVFREASEANARAIVLRALADQGGASQAVWDALLCGAAELSHCRPASLLSLHAVTSADALAFAFTNVADRETRGLILLHAVVRLIRFRDYIAEKEGAIGQRVAIDALTPASERPSLEALVDAPAEAAAPLVLAYLQAGGSTRRLMAAQRRIVIARADDPHDYKLCEAIVTSLAQISPPWRPAFLAATLGRLPRATGVPSPRVSALLASDKELRTQ
jgi:hypothetical protein